MTKQQFKSALTRGLGSALVELMTCSDPSRYRDIVRYACLHNTTHDVQSEGARGWYLFRAIQLVEGADLFENDIIDQFHRMTSDDWLFEQLISLLVEYAANGSQKAHQALYSKYDQLRIIIESMNEMKDGCSAPNMLEWLSEWLTNLDGFPAFEQIAMDFGRNIQNGRADSFFFDSFFANARVKFGSNRVERFLARRAVQSPELKAFFDSVQETTSLSREEEPPSTLAEILEKARQITGKYQYLNRFMMRRYAQNASPEELAELAATALREPNEAIRSELLWTLRHAKDPVLPFATLCDLANSENENIRDTAYELMLLEPSDEVHDLALRLISEGRDLLYGISLLSRNFRRTDESIVFETIRKLPVNKISEWHEAFEAAIRIYEKGRWIPNTDLLGYMYETTLCGFCRLDIVERMHQHRALTPDQAYACLFDSNPEIRAFARRLKVNRWIGLSAVQRHRSD